MKVLNLACSQQHLFEGWFASEDDFVAQCGRGDRLPLDAQYGQVMHPVHLQHGGLAHAELLVA
jgi:hypothetical protein